MEETMGGDVKKQIIKYANVMFPCTCKKIIENPNIMGYKHTGGKKDATGTKWWLYVKCGQCSYDWALHKIDRRVMLLDKQTEPDMMWKFVSDLTYKHMEGLKDKMIPAPCVIYALHFPHIVDIIPISGFRGRSPMDFIKPALAAENPDAWLVIAEGWMRMMKASDERKKEIEKMRYGDIAKRSDKKEVLTVHAGSKDGTLTGYAKMYYIVRDPLTNNITDYVIMPEGELRSDKIPGLGSIKDGLKNWKKEVKKSGK